MVEKLFFVFFGFCLAAFFIALLYPIVRRQLKRQLRTQFEARVPKTIQDVAAKADFMRAQHAVEVCRLEEEIERLHAEVMRARVTFDQAKRSSVLLNAERSVYDEELTGMREQLEEIRTALRQKVEENSKISADLRKYQRLFEREEKDGHRLEALIQRMRVTLGPEGLFNRRESESSSLSLQQGEKSHKTPPAKSKTAPTPQGQPSLNLYPDIEEDATQLFAEIEAFPPEGDTASVKAAALRERIAGLARRFIEVEDTLQERTEAFELLAVAEAQVARQLVNAGSSTLPLDAPGAQEVFSPPFAQASPVKNHHKPGKKATLSRPEKTKGRTVFSRKIGRKKFTKSSSRGVL